MARRAWNGWGDSVLGYACEVLAVATYVCWVLPKVAWMRWTGRIPPRGD